MCDFCIKSVSLTFLYFLYLQFSFLFISHFSALKRRMIDFFFFAPQGYCESLCGVPTSPSYLHHWVTWRAVMCTNKTIHHGVPETWSTAGTKTAHDSRLIASLLHDTVSKIKRYKPDQTQKDFISGLRRQRLIFHD